MRDKHLISFLSEGYFYILDISNYENGGRLLVKLNIRIPNESIQTYDIDYNMTTVLIGTTNGNVFLYDLHKALENERVLSQKKIQMGVEEALVFTYLQ